MKIVLLGHEDLASLYALDTLVAANPGHDYTVFWSGALKASTGPDALATLADIDARLYREYLARPETSKVFTQAKSLPQPNEPAGLSLLEAESPDLVVSIRYRRILKDAAIGIPVHGVLNLHSGILPDYRGVMATFWAMLHDEAEIGTTLHRIVDAGIDTGPVLAITRRPADYGATYLANVLALYADGVLELGRAIGAIERGEEAGGAGQSASEGAYFGPPGAADVEKFLAKGLKLADGAEFGAFQARRTAVRGHDDIT